MVNHSKSHRFLDFPREIWFTHFSPELFYALINRLSTKHILYCLLFLCAPCYLQAKAPDPTILIATNAIWKYNDHGQDLVVEQWKSLSYFEDLRWKSGAAELGFGSTPEGR